MPADQEQDWYAILGTHSQASQQEIRKCYLQLLLSEHPDKGGDAVRFELIQKAYNFLSDPLERAIFDEHLERRAAQRCAHGNTRGTKTYHAEECSMSTAEGVTAFVHGQTRVPRPSSRHPQPCCPGSSQVEAASSRIRKLVKQIETEEDDSQTRATLAEAYVARGRVHVADGRPHHAAFDAEEALRLIPGNVEAEALLSDIALDSPPG